MKSKWNLLFGTGLALTLILQTVVLQGHAAEAESHALRIDFESGQVSDSRGTPVRTLLTSGDATEQITFGRTEQNVSVKVVSQSALPLPEGIFEPGLNGTPPEGFVETDSTITREGSLVGQAVDSGALERRFMYAMTPTEISLAWAEVPNATAYNVSVDGVVIHSDAQSAFSLGGFAPGDMKTFSIEAVNESGEALSTRTFAAQFASSYRPVSSRSYQTYNSSFVYRTFIPMASVGPLDLPTTLGCGQFLQGNRTFSGDNRTWVTPPFNTPSDNTSYRTSVFLNVNWDNPAPWDIVWSTKVRPTRLLENGVQIDTRTASSDGIQVSDAYTSGAYAQARISHVVGNPYCSAGAITYNAVVRMYRSGVFEVVGYRYPVPAHEVYGGWDVGGYVMWYPIIAMPHTAFVCLLGWCGTQGISASATH